MLCKKKSGIAKNLRERRYLLSKKICMHTEKWLMSAELQLLSLRKMCCVVSWLNERWMDECFALKSTSPSSCTCI